MLIDIISRAGRAAALFCCRYPAHKKTGLWIWNGFLYLLGILAWGVFFSWGVFSLEFADWSLITGPRFQLLKSAAEQGVFPFQISDSATLKGLTDGYLAIPDAFISPQYLLLRWMGVNRFAFVNVVLLYTLGFYGLWRLQRRFKLSPLAFSAIFLLLNFNGHMIAHYAVGHATWGGNFLFPFFIELVFDLLDGQKGWRWIVKISALLFVVYLQGSFHQFVWMLALLLLVGVTHPKLFWPALQAAFFACLASAFRILPPALLLGQFDNVFLGGFPTTISVWESLVQIRTPNDIALWNDLTRAVGMWEYSFYLGFGGTLAVLIFGLYHWQKNNRSQLRRSLLLPMLLMILITLGDNYRLVQSLPVPLFTAGRMATRSLILPLSFLIVIAAVEFQKWLDVGERPAWVTGVSALVVMAMAVDLWQNLRIWRISAILEKYEFITFDPRNWYVNNHLGDVPYLLLVAGGALISLATFAFLGLKVKAEQNRAAAPVKLK